MAAMEALLPLEAAGAAKSASFLVRAEGAERAPVSYVSRGCRLLFGFSEKELSSAEGAPAPAPVIEAARTLELAPQATEKRLHFLACYAAAERREVVGSTPCEKIGVALVLSRSASGRLFVCEVTTFTFEDLEGAVQSVSVQRDVTNATPIAELMSIAGSGEYFRLVRARRAALNSPESILYAKSKVVPALQALLAPPPAPAAARAACPLMEGRLPDFVPAAGGAAGAAPAEASRLRRMAHSADLPPYYGAKIGGA